MTTTDYFAYGTLLDVAAMQAFVSSARPQGLWRLAGYEMGFAETIQRGKGGCCLVARPGAETYGLVYSMSAADRAALDAASGIAQGLWIHKSISVTGEGGRRLDTRTYTIPGEPPPFAPSEDYVSSILRGLEALPLPAAYVVRMRSIIADAVAAAGPAGADGR